MWRNFYLHTAPALFLALGWLISLPVHSANSYWQGQVKHLCNWRDQQNTSLNLPPLEVCGELETLGEAVAELVYADWWKKIKKRRLSYNQLFDSFFAYTEERFRQGEQYVDAERLAEEKSDFMLRVKNVTDGVTTFGKFSESIVCENQLAFSGESVRTACQLAREELELLSGAEVIEWWGSLFENKEGDALGLIYWMEQWRGLEEREIKQQEREKREKELKAEAAKQFRKKVPSMGSRDLCSRFGDGRQSVIKNELKRRKTFSDTEWRLIEGRQIQLGMSELALICSWGDAEYQNRSVGPWGEHIQYVYPNDVYVYVQNGKVTSWQD